MEWAIHVGQGSLAEHWDELLSEPRRWCEPALRELQAAVVELIWGSAGRVRPRRAYVGNEFCQNLVPSLESFTRVCSTLWERDLAITFLTPPVTDEGLEKLHPLFAWLARQEHSVEVVFNDWGTLGVLRREFAELRPVQGRLLNKLLRDPRVTPLYNSPDSPQGVRAAMQQTNSGTHSLQRLLARYGVETVEQDILLQGLDADFHRLPFDVAFYFPYGFVTTGRLCMIGSLHLEGCERFQPNLRCQHECQLYMSEHKFLGTTLPTRGTAFFQRGNTFFYSPDAQLLGSFLGRAEAMGVGRLVYEPRLPM